MVAMRTPFGAMCDGTDFGRSIWAVSLSASGSLRVVRAGVRMQDAHRDRGQHAELEYLLHLEDHRVMLREQEDHAKAPGDGQPDQPPPRPALASVEPGDEEQVQ